MKKLLLVVLLGLTASLFAAEDDDNKAADRVKSASTILEEIQAAPDTGIPDEVMGSAECVAVVPSMLKAGFVFGARYGRGVASCRTAKGWSDPAFFAIQGGSFGLSADLQAKATALNREERRIAPSLGSAATGDAASVLSAKYESGFQHRGHDGHALGRSHNFVGNAGIGSGLDFLQHCRRRFDAIRSLIVVVAGEGRGGKGQN